MQKPYWNVAHLQYWSIYKPAFSIWWTFYLTFLCASKHTLHVAITFIHRWLWGSWGIPDICQFWDTTALFSPVKVHQKVRKFAIRVICAKQSTDLKKYTTIGCCGCDKYQLWLFTRLVTQIWQICTLSHLIMWVTCRSYFYSDGKSFPPFFSRLWRPNFAASRSVAFASILHLRWHSWYYLTGWH